MDECDMDIRFCRQLQCQNTVGTYTCGCRQGFKKVVADNLREYACTDIDECWNKYICPKNAVCQNQEGDYKCTCNSGFDGETCSDVDECSINSTVCDADADCYNTQGSFKCACRKGFVGTGLKCEKGQCQDSVCPSNKKCASLTTINCLCKEGFLDGVNDTCVDMDECSRQIHNCDENSQCSNLLGSYECECADEFHGNGRTCLPGHCNDSDCPKNEQCVDPRSDCKCKAGFHRDKSKKCIDTNECEKENDCHQDARCLNTVGSYTCECETGFYGTGYSCLAGECSDASCPGNQTCIAPTSTSCDCSKGLNKIGENCFDINECSLGIHKCKKNLECVNNLGDYACEPFCENGFERSYDGTCLDIDECASNLHNCSSGRCVNTDGGFSCKE